MIIHCRTCSYLMLFFGLALGTLAQGDDLCDPVDMNKKVNVAKESSEYRNCELQKLAENYINSCHDLVDVYALLKDTYLQHLNKLEDGSDTQAAEDEYAKLLQSAKDVIQKGVDMDLTTKDGLSKLKNRVPQVHTHLQEPRSKVSKIRHESVSDPHKITVCRAKYFWKMNKILNERLMSCVDKALSQER